MNDDKRNANRRAEHYWSEDIQSMVERTMRYYGDMASLCIDLMAGPLGAVVKRGVVGRSPAPAVTKEDAEWVAGPPLGSPTREARDAGQVSLRVDVHSKAPAQILLDVNRRVAGRTLAVQPLLHVDALEAPPIRGATLKQRDEHGRLELQLILPDVLPPGTYVGAVIDKNTGEPCGTVSVVVPR